MSAIFPRGLYTAAESRAVDAAAIRDHGLPGPQLMARAARAAFEHLLRETPEPDLVQILCGPGNNGGDGLLLAILCAGRGVPVQLFMVAGPPRSDDACLAAERARGAGLTWNDYESGALRDEGIVVDAMLGTGLNGAPRDAYAEAIRDVNALKRPVLALDVPSGVNADTGAALGDAIRATWTMSFITAKRGLYTGRGPGYAGVRAVDDLGVPQAAYAVVQNPCARLHRALLDEFLPPRRQSAHKGHAGRCLLIGGDTGMGGAIIMAAEAALRCGVGLARVATRPEHIPALLARRPECMAVPVTHRNDLESELGWPDAVALGPGLGQEPWGEQMLNAALSAGRPLVLDADALNLLSHSREVSLGSDCVITPHPGEAARLLDITVEQVEEDRFAAAHALYRKTGAVTLLKGPGSVVAGPGGLALCDAGNPGMASGGMGDVLTGVVAALLAQGLDAEEAARRGALLHSTAADYAVREHGEASLLAGDVISAIPGCLA